MKKGIYKIVDRNTGEAITEYQFNQSQIDFWNSEEQYVLISGGLGSGKSLVMLLRVIHDAITQDNNYILIGRSTYQEIYDVMVKDFFELCHPSWILEYRKTPHPTVVVRTVTGGTSEIIFRNLDKVSKSELLGLNLGEYAIDQAEDVPEEIVLTLNGRLRRKGIKHRGYMTSNPKLSWLYRVFKQEQPPNHRLIEVSTLENKQNLPESYMQTLEQYPESWYKQYVLGIWDETLLSDNIVFAREHIEKLGKNVREPTTVEEGLAIYYEHEDGHEYQIGVDMAEGGVSTEESLRKDKKDSAVIVVWDLTDDKEAAMWSGKVSPRITAEKAVWIAAKYNNPLIVPEMNSMGVAFLDKLDDLGYSNIYRREEYDKVRNKTLKQYGWRTTSSTKQLLIAHFEELLRKRNPLVHSRETVAEFKTFVYTSEAKKSGAGAQAGYHDDKIMATMLAAYQNGPVQSTTVRSSRQRKLGVPVQESFTVVNGKIRPHMNTPGRYAHWQRL